MCSNLTKWRSEGVENTPPSTVVGVSVEDIRADVRAEARADGALSLVVASRWAR